MPTHGMARCVGCMWGVLETVCATQLCTLYSHAILTVAWHPRTPAHQHHCSPPWSLAIHCISTSHFCNQPFSGAPHILLGPPACGGCSSSHSHQPHQQRRCYVAAPTTQRACHVECVFHSAAQRPSTAGGPRTAGPPCRGGWAVCGVYGLRSQCKAVGNSVERWTCWFVSVCVVCVWWGYCNTMYECTHLIVNHTVGFPPQYPPHCHPTTTGLRMKASIPSTYGVLITGCACLVQVHAVCASVPQHSWQQWVCMMAQYTYTASFGPWGLGVGWGGGVCGC